MLHTILLLLTTSTLLVSAFPKEPLDQNDRQYFLLQPSFDDQATAAQTQNEEKVKEPLERQQVYQPRGYSGTQFLQPQFQYPVYNQQAFARVQPSFLFYGAGGQGQPILINPGSPPGNFLVPHPQQPGTNVFLRGNPQTPIFVGGFPNPKPAHIPPIEKDAEEVPTDPSSIPPLPSSHPEGKTPEKLETFNEDKPEPQSKSTDEAEVLAQADKNPQPITRNNLKPGQRFFILNGEPLYQNYPINYQQDPNLAFQHIDQPFQQLRDGQRPQEFNYNIPQELLLRNIPNFNAHPDDNSAQTPTELNQQQNGQRYTQSFIPLYPNNLPQEASLRGALPGLVQLNQQDAPQQPLFRTNLQGPDTGRFPIGQFRYTPPNQAYFPFEDDSDNDAVVVNANFDDNANAEEQNLPQPDISLPATKSTDPSTAQAAPGAVALAGPGGIAGAAPKATALAGKGGLAVSSPKATAIAGTKEEEKEEKDKQEQDKKPAKKPKK